MWYLLYVKYHMISCVTGEQQHYFFLSVKNLMEIGVGFCIAY